LLIPLATGNRKLKLAGMTQMQHISLTITHVEQIWTWINRKCSARFYFYH